MSCIFIPLPPLLAFRIHIENITKFFHHISNATDREIIIHLSDTTHWFGASKFINLTSRRTRVMMKGVEMKKHRMGGINTI
jgi:hypothetical protein